MCTKYDLLVREYDTIYVGEISQYTVRCVVHMPIDTSQMMKELVEYVVVKCPICDKGFLFADPDIPISKQKKFVCTYCKEKLLRNVKMPTLSKLTEEEVCVLQKAENDISNKGFTNERCPRCNSKIIIEEVGKSYSVRCISENCISLDFRGI